jgi:signal transduction histidine kinase
MAEIGSRSQLQDWTPRLTTWLAVLVAVGPPVVVSLVHNSDNPSSRSVLVTATVLWLALFIGCRFLALRLERQKRDVLRDEIAAMQRALIETSDLCQDRLHEQHAILDGIRDISNGILDDGIIEPSQTLARVKEISSRAFEGQGVIDDAIAEVRVETGSTSFTFEQLDVREEIDAVVAPYLRSGFSITTDGPRHYVETDPAVFRLVLRSLVKKAIHGDASTVEVAVARDNMRVVCTVSDDGVDRSYEGLAGLSLTTRTLVTAVGGELRFSRALGRNHLSISVPRSESPQPGRTSFEPIDVLGSRPLSSAS